MPAAARRTTLVGREAAFVKTEPVIPKSSDPAVATLETESRGALVAAVEKLSEERERPAAARYVAGPPRGVRGAGPVSGTLPVPQPRSISG
ncbi:hypothetical protein [Streptomyces griseoloalbus]|uniref:hypothetical protein n=1 Tax=Streptomyces griseoloalbus TaxID=67303 RepID=UPI003F54112B